MSFLINGPFELLLTSVVNGSATSLAVVSPCDSPCTVLGSLLLPRFQLIALLPKLRPSDCKLPLVSIRFLLLERFVGIVQLIETLQLIILQRFNECCLANAFTLSFGVYTNACAITFFQFLLPLLELEPPSVITCDALALCPVRIISLLYLVPANQVSCILRTQLPNSLVSFTPLTLFN